MEAPVTLIPAHPAGEDKTAPKYPSGSWPVDTPGGRFHAEWDDQAPVTRKGQLIFFFQFLHTGGRWEEFLRGCPLHDTATVAAARATSWAPPCSASSAATGATPTSAPFAATASTPDCLA